MPKINQKEYEVLKGLGNTWKWIARNKDGDLGVYYEKVIKVKFYNFWIMAIKKKIDSALFSFIQWEDEEPYLIADLIMEYEIKELRLAPSGTVVVDLFDEGEEVEVKKDKEWAKKEVDKYFSYKGVVEARNALVFVKGVIDQLDEPEVTLDKAFEKVAESYPMTKEEIWRHLERLEAHGGKVTYEGLDNPEVLSQKWIDENKVARIDDVRKMTTSDVVAVEKLQNLLVPTLSKKKKVQLSQKTADELNRYKELGYSLKDLLVIASSKQAQEKLARAWLDGFTVEEEQMYYLKIGNLYLAEPLGDMTSDIVRMTRDKGVAYQFTGEKSIATHLDKFEGTEAVKVEELEE